MRILSIETSCDETGITILEAKGSTKNPAFKILANELASQAKLHAPYGGVYPNLAKREHIKNLPILLEQVLKNAGVLRKRTSSQRDGARKAIRQQADMRGESAKNPGIDAIMVTSGPGLEPALWAGIVFAEELGKNWGVPVVPVNHMEGHVLSVFAPSSAVGKFFQVLSSPFPALALLVSGGHTELVLVKDWGKYQVIGETLDDAAGEAFDKVARMLGLPYPGGPEISRLAEALRKSSGNTVLRSLGRSDGSGQRKFSPENFRAEQSSIPAIKLPRPMLKSPNFDFSFSGLKTAVLYLTRKIGKLDKKTKSAIALEFENAVVETLVYKTQKAVEKYRAKTLIVAGGVASNKHLKEEIKKTLGGKTKILFPGHGLATDNSVMIGMAGYLKYLKNPKKRYKIRAEGGLRL